MRATEVSYLLRRNKGNYEHEEVSISAVLEDGDDSIECVQVLKRDMEIALGLRTVEATPAKKEEAVKEEAPVKEEPKKEPAKKVAKKAPAKKKPEAKEEAPKSTVKYDREIQEHKDELAMVFDAVSPGWNKDPKVKASCVAISKEMVGEAIFGSDGEVLESFVELVRNKLEEAEGDL